MSMGLSSEQLDAYRRDGYIVVEDLVTPAEVQALRSRGELQRGGVLGLAEQAPAHPLEAARDESLGRIQERQRPRAETGRPGVTYWRLETLEWTKC